MKMAGKMGCKYRDIKGLKIWRINTKYNMKNSNKTTQINIKQKNTTKSKFHFLTNELKKHAA